jgi:hypothetical protein
MQHVAGTHGANVLGMKSNDRDRTTFRRNELDLERIGGVTMHNCTHVALLKTVVRERTAKHNRVWWLHHGPPLQG